MAASFTLFDASALLDRLVKAAKDPWRPVVFLVGSPLTAPVASGGPGVPGVAQMIERVRRVLGNDDVPSPEAENPYQDAFKTLLARRGPDEVNLLVRQAVLKASVGHPRDLTDAALRREPHAHGQACDALEEDLDGWHLSPGVEYLGRLTGRYPQYFGRTVLTGNFDPLIEISCRRAGRPCWRTALHGDGELHQGRGDVCNVVHVHGYWYAADTLHLPGQLEADRPKLRASLRRLFEDVTLVVVAYGGWNDVFTQALFDVVNDGGAFPEVIWTFYQDDETSIAETSRRLLESLRPGLQRGRVTLYGDVDCHEFFRELWERLQAAPSLDPVIMAPRVGEKARASATPAAESDRRRPFVVGTPIEHDEDLFGRWAQRERLHDAIERCQPVQILGERRMGKTSLLRWVERHARDWQGRPVAWVNAQGLAGHSPESWSSKRPGRWLGFPRRKRPCGARARDRKPPLRSSAAFFLSCSWSTRRPPWHSRGMDLTLISSELCGRSVRSASCCGSRPHTRTFSVCFVRRVSRRRSSTMRVRSGSASSRTMRRESWSPRRASRSSR